MSIHENQHETTPPKQYTPAKGEFVAEQYANGETLANLAAGFPDYLPAAMYMKQWRHEYPAFNELMKLAEAARADVMMQDCFDIADDTGRQAAQAANAIKVRQAMAAALDSNTYGNRRILAGDKDNPLLVAKAEALTDDQLLAIARGAMQSAGITHDSMESRPPAPPPATERTPPTREVRGTQKPLTISQEPSVTTLDIKKGAGAAMAISERKPIANIGKVSTLKPKVVIEPKGVDPGF